MTAYAIRTAICVMQLGYDGSDTPVFRKLHRTTVYDSMRTR
jgi:hypothetical protein